MNLRQVRLRHVVTLLGTTVGIVREVERMLDRIERQQRSALPRSLAVLALAGGGAAALTIALRPELRRKLRDTISLWIGQSEAQPGVVPEAAPVTMAPAVGADVPEPYVNGARP